ncbi:uncharacterized protein MYCGRDRAFT_42293 [Zymoseptoria tritici IPO323]|uniref:GST N-terminal domain-containing protein n=1 Tax=Zymoseptoria tritici (strain CBS 115943 / IPO323) TaxID=336722 RepID=F9XC82_ZYMTI|nr:uncharacterized protein MYCGRDRAFT_42293 [Zymoseptoria tritici IPO323]EGP87614.1 hypothetical protein MYCGRDRAFT_42293 [Zymoseptoria tritici IPO323]
MTSENPIVFYDIASDAPRRTFAPNPWKTRFALNFKGVPYRTEWTHMPNITSVREKLGVPANRTLPDGTPYHTLPVIHDVARGEVIGDTFEIALYLDRAFPDSPSLFRPSTTGLTAALNQHIDGLFTKHVGLCSTMPFDPSVKDECMAIFAKRAGVKSLEDVKMTPKQREAMFVSFEAALGELAKRSGRQGAAMFLDGEGPAYGDFVVGAWLKMMEASMATEDWTRVKGFQGGFWGRVVDALSPWTEIK